MEAAVYNLQKIVKSYLISIKIDDWRLIIKLYVGNIFLHRQIFHTVMSMPAQLPSSSPEKLSLSL